MKQTAATMRLAPFWLLLCAVVERQKPLHVSVRDTAISEIGRRAHFRSTRQRISNSLVHRMLSKSRVVFFTIEIYLKFMSSLAREEFARQQSILLLNRPLPH
jgi:hypothetical protein